MATTVTTADIGKVIARLPDLVKSTGHNEIYGIQLVPAVASRDTATSEAVVPPPVKLIIGKFLRAHKSDIEVTISGIKETLLWRKEFNPRKAAFEEEHDSKFNGIGYNTVFKDDNGKGNDIIVWNIYGEWYQSRRTSALNVHHAKSCFYCVVEHLFTYRCPTGQS